MKHLTMWFVPVRDAATGFIKQLRPHVNHPATMIATVVAFGFGIFLIIWNTDTFRLEHEAANLAWPTLISFGIMWLAGRGGRRILVGLVFGVLVGLTGFYGVMSFLPVTPAAIGIGLGVVGATAAIFGHVLPELLSFGAMAAGYGVGLGAALSAGFRPTTSAADMAAVIGAVTLAVVLGALGAEVLRGIATATPPGQVSFVAIPFPRHRARSKKKGSMDVRRPAAVLAWFPRKHKPDADPRVRVG